MSPTDVLEFWFGTPDPPGNLSDEAFGRFWKKDESFDSLVRERFGAVHEQASRGDLDDWKATPRGRVALVIVLDQFSRNMFRGDARTFAQDPQALDKALAGIDAGELERLTPMQRYFLIMPLMHSEDLAIQERCVTLFDELAAQTAEAGLKKRFSSAADFARRHRDIVARFGRFPHRNAVLGRASTAEETEFLQQPGSSF
jgi:uncharacterized protein (DUF924 family)